MTTDQSAISSYDHPDPPIVLQSDAEKDVEIITNGIMSKLALVHTGLPNVIIVYGPEEDFTGTVLLEVQVPAESELGALSALYGELSVVLSKLMEMCAELRTKGGKE